MAHWLLNNVDILLLIAGFGLALWAMSPPSE